MGLRLTLLPSHPLYRTDPAAQVEQAAGLLAQALRDGRLVDEPGLAYIDLVDDEDKRLASARFE